MIVRAVAYESLYRLQNCMSISEHWSLADRTGCLCVCLCVSVCMAYLMLLYHGRHLV